MGAGFCAKRERCTHRSKGSQPIRERGIGLSCSGPSMGRKSSPGRMLNPKREQWWPAACCTEKGTTTRGGGNEKKNDGRTIASTQLEDNRRAGIKSGPAERRRPGKPCLARRPVAENGQRHEPDSRGGGRTILGAQTRSLVNGAIFTYRNSEARRGGSTCPRDGNEG